MKLAIALLSTASAVLNFEMGNRWIALSIAIMAALQWAFAIEHARKHEDDEL